ncbi:hypothetical protein [Mycoplasma phocimorsus]|uniref:Uncharacterized protein n=1 Tax=Mycoplasma phocimorsus TaxID=3045839 RepID=A0AAJ1UZL7_9MOLU|nr:hypothetical protein [Mycoplasma phocimorsus]MDJ1645853.1 hypothetical protein [Mycoplasma phocimorsus]MDJ1647020.1 hypothetical protein [Mycoplasma phocimorsus]MDJ1648001.1 hypothetical protein [Mycoplasma phocimorsus]
MKKELRVSGCSNDSKFKEDQVIIRIATDGTGNETPFFKII